MTSAILDGLTFTVDDMIGTDGKGYAQIQDSVSGTLGTYEQEALFPDRFMGAFINESYSQLLAIAGGYSSTSTTSMTVSNSGSVTFTMGTAKLFARGLRIRIADSSAPGTNYMEGTITAYDSSTGSTTVLRDTSAGSGTLTSWTIGLAAIAFSAAAVNVFTGQQSFATATLTDGATINWNLNTQQKAKVTLGGARTLANPTNMVDGGEYRVIVTQDGTGGRTLAYGSAYKWPGGSAPVLSTGIGAVDALFFESDGTSMFGTFQLNYS